MNTAFTMRDTSFPVEFAQFVAFVGAENLMAAVSRVMSKFDTLSPAMRTLYRKRYFFHLQCLAFTDGAAPFRLDVSDHCAVRTATLIAGINRVRTYLPSKAHGRFRSVICGGLRPDRDIRQLEHEIRSFIHFGQKGLAITLADLESDGQQFDMECRSVADIAFDVECKTVTEDTGAPVKTDLFVNLAEEFRRAMHSTTPTLESGIFVLSFRRPTEQCRDLATTLRNALCSSPFVETHCDDFGLVFEPRPEWTVLAASAAANEVRIVIGRDLGSAGYQRHVATKVGNRVFALALLSDRPNRLSEKVTSVLKEAADQCSRQRPSLVWLHFVEHPEQEFLQLAEHSQQGRGLNVIVTNVLHPNASTTDRSHVHTIRFSAEAESITHRPVLDSELLLRRAGSLSGPCYDVRNPYCRYKENIDF
jgi:hypothetical protein